MQGGQGEAYDRGAGAGGAVGPGGLGAEEVEGRLAGEGHSVGLGFYVSLLRCLLVWLLGIPGPGPYRMKKFP